MGTFFNCGHANFIMTRQGFLYITLFLFHSTLWALDRMNTELIEVLKENCVSGTLYANVIPILAK